MDFTTITVNILTLLSQILHGYGWAIIFLTVLVRVILWPLNTSQQRSMKKMQELSPKLKLIQDRYKSDPQLMQRKMMEFYKEHKFNPFGGCFPLLLQMPIFIMLYAALISPQFNEVAGNSSFFFIHHLNAPIKGHAGKIGDQIFGVEKGDTFSSGNYVTVYTKKGVIHDVKVNNPSGIFLNKENKQTIIPEKPVDLKFSADQINLPYSDLTQAEKADVLVSNNVSKEIEHITFIKKDSFFEARIKTEKVTDTFNYDVLILVILFGLTMFLSQKVMTSTTATTDSSQQAMQQQMSTIMPFMITAMFVFFPIPAGVLLYMVISNILQIFQTVLVNKQIESEKITSKESVVKDMPGDAKKIEASEVKTSEQSSDSSKNKDRKGKW